MRDFSIGSDIDMWRVLATVCPAERILVIGAPPELLGSLFKASHESAVIVADTRPESERVFSRLLGDRPHAEIFDVFVAPESGDRAFFDLSIKSESGLIAPDALSNFWPNIHAKSQTSVQAEGIVELLGRAATGTHWLILNRLDSLALCSRIEDWIELPNVIIARADSDPQTTQAEEISSVPALTERLAPFGYQNVAVLPDTHPRLRHVVYARAATQLVEETNRQLQEHKLLADQKLDALTSELEHAREQSQEIQSKLSFSENNLQDLRGAHQALAQRCDQQSDAISALKTKLLELQGLLTQHSKNQSDIS